MGRAPGHRAGSGSAIITSERSIDVPDSKVPLLKSYDVSDLLRDLNEARKSVAYGDIGLPELDAEDVASRIEAYIESVSALIEQGRAQ